MMTRNMTIPPVDKISEYICGHHSMEVVKRVSGSALAGEGSVCDGAEGVV